MRYCDILEDADAAGFNIDAYHGTTANFDAFDPRRTGDIGLHFGTIQQANNAVRHAWKPGYPDGANVIPVKLRLRNVLPVKDLFSTLKTTFLNRAKVWTLETRGFHPSTEERAEIYAAAKAADAARRRAGGDWGKLNPAMDAKQQTYEQASRRFWQAIEVSCIRQGYDGLVYNNRVEGKGDSYVVFDPKNVRSRHARFDPAKADSDNLMDAHDPAILSEIERGGELSDDAMQDRLATASHDARQGDLLDPSGYDQDYTPVGSFDGYQVAIMHPDTIKTDNTIYVIFRGGEAVAYAELEPIGDETTSFKVKAVRVTASGSGKGLGLRFYRWLLTRGHVDYLYADDNQTEPGARIWERLLASPDVAIFVGRTGGNPEHAAVRRVKTVKGLKKVWDTDDYFLRASAL